MNATRRDVLLGGLVGAGWLGLRALATGLPPSFLLRAGAARAETDTPACAGPQDAQFLILSINQDGDPINANAPGTYEDPGIVHPDPAVAPGMAPTPIHLGTTETVAAQPWSTLPRWVLDRACFFHMATRTTIHPDLPNVLQLMGETAGSEMLPSIFSRYLSGCLGTVRASPVSLLGTTRPEYVMYGGQVIPNLNATALRDILARPEGPLGQLAKLRDQSMDRIFARIKAAGTASPAQKAYVDSLARSRDEARAISDKLVNDLAAIADDDAAGQIIGAATLVAMNVTPVVVVRIPFGGDNHFDPELALESEQTVAGVQAIGAMMSKLEEYGLADRVTFASLNVFGRTLKQRGTEGRNHWADHHVSVVIGKPARAGVIGGVTASAATGDYTALPIESQSGLGIAGGDVPMHETLSAFGKTLGAMVGVPQAVLDQSITKGKIVTAALA
ncbi:DUF1501 domain-containing protein [Sorangium sp. So ce1128]